MKLTLNSSLEKIEHLREAIVLQKTKTTTKWLEWKLLIVKDRQIINDKIACC